MKLALKAVAVPLALALGVFGAPDPSDAQRSQKIPRIGLLLASSPTLNPYLPQAFRQGLHDLGYVEGRNVLIEARYAEGQLDRLPGLAAELVALNVEVIVTAGHPAISAAKRATTTIPIVFAAAGDPVAAGYAASLARPGGNITGLSVLGTDLSGKRLQLLKELYPHAMRLALLFNPADSGMAIRVTEARAAARALRVAVLPLEVRSVGELETAFSTMTKERPDALVTIFDGFTLRHRKQIVDFAAANRLPAIYETRQFVEIGGLMSYGPVILENYRRAATYVDKILKGTKPADLPIEQPTKFELIINLKAAKALGLAIPQALLARVDQVID